MGLQVRPNQPALPKLFRTSNQAVDPQRSINEVGQIRVHALWLGSQFVSRKPIQSPLVSGVCACGPHHAGF